MGDENSIVDELKEAFKDLGIPETSVVDNEISPQPKSKPKSTPGSVKPSSSFDPKKINEVIFLEKQVVEPERLNAIRASISKWANSIPHHDLTDLGNKIELTSVYERPSYLIALHTQYESRELKKGEYPGDGIPPLALIEKDVDVWNMDVPLFEDFVDKQINYLLEGSNEVFECGECDGHGEVDCSRCNRSGIVTCSKCTGNGNIKCSTCNGNGEIKCSSCYGRGEKVCWSCGGKGCTGIGSSQKRTCTSCGGRGYKPCTSCRNGFNRCSSCSGKGEVRCSNCAGKGEVRCIRCNGRGILTCSRCKGEGRICQFIYLDNVFKPASATSLISHPDIPFRLCNGEILLGEEKVDIGVNEEVEKDVEDDEEVDEDEGNSNDIVNKTTKKTLKKSLIGVLPEVVLVLVDRKFPDGIFAPLSYDHVKKAISELITASVKNTDDNERIIKHEIRVYKINSVAVGYSYSSKQYSLALYGNDYEKISIKTSPIHEVGDTYFASAQKLFKGREFSQALEVIEKALSISPDRNEAKELKKKILHSIKAEYTVGGISGGLITAMLFRLYWAHNESPFWGNTGVDTLKVSMFLFMGLMIGTLTAAIFVGWASIKIKENRKRVLYPFVVSILITIGLVVLWNSANERLWSKQPEIKAQEQKEDAKSAKKTEAKAQKQKGHAATTKGASADDWHNKGVSLAKAGDFKEAIVAFNKVIEIDPNHPKDYYNRGLAYYNLGNHEQAISNYNKAIEIDPDNVNLYINLGAAYIELKNYQEALTNFDTAIKLDPNDAEGFVNRGIAYGKLGDEQRQIDDYKTAAQMGNMRAQEALKKANIEW